MNEREEINIIIQILITDSQLKLIITIIIDCLIIDCCNNNRLIIR